MRLSKASYYADFVVYPPVVLGLAVATLRHPTSWAWLEWWSACLAGIAVWTLCEYIIHRGILHEVPYFSEMHDMHHDDPTGFVGTPTWLSLSMICLAALLPSWWEAGFDVAGGLTSGLMIGYLWYVGIHHIVHHWPIGPGTYLYRVKRRHALHHYSRVSCNYGVTTGVWDHVFGTAHPSR